MITAEVDDKNVFTVSAKTGLTKSKTVKMKNNDVFHQTNLIRDTHGEAKMQKDVLGT